VKLYIDSADASTWDLPPGSPTVVGVTTNPSLVYQAGLPVSERGYRELIARAAGHGFTEIMLQVPDADVRENVRLAAQLQELAHGTRIEITLKLPCDPRWEASIDGIHALGLPTLLTGLSNPLQLLWARERQSRWVAPYVGRLEAAGRDVWALMQACVHTQSASPGLLAASVRSGDVLARLMGLGAQAVTLRPDFIASLCTDAVTLAAIAQFDSDTHSSLQRKDPL
jgi:transaldolase